MGKKKLNTIEILKDFNETGRVKEYVEYDIYAKVEIRLNEIQDSLCLNDDCIQKIKDYRESRGF